MAKQDDSCMLGKMGKHMLLAAELHQALKLHREDDCLGMHKDLLQSMEKASLPV